MNFEYFLINVEAAVATVRLNRPEKANSLHLAAWAELKNLFEWISTNEEIRVVILKGEGAHFCSGIDLELLMSVNDMKEITCSGRRAERLLAFITNLQDAVSAIEKCRKPVIAAIHGGCIGGGVDIAAACDMRYCTDQSFFSIKEIDMGMVADLGTLQRLPKIIGAGLLSELSFTGRKVFGQEAAAMQLCNKSFLDVPAMEQGVQEIASQIAQKSPLSIRGTKKVLQYAREHSTADSLEQIALWNSAMFISEDLDEAFEAKLKNRKPQFKN